MSHLKLAKGMMSGFFMCLSATGFAGSYGVVDIQKIILTVDEGVQARKTLEAEFKKKETELLGRQKEIDKLMEDAQKQVALLSDEAKLAKQKEIQDKAIGLRNDQMKYQGEMKNKEGQATQKIAAKVAALVDGMAKAKGLDLVFEASGAGLVYMKDPVDLTPDVIKAFGSETPKKEAKK